MRTLNKLVAVALFATLSGNALALRCGTQLIDIGDSLYKVRSACQISSEYRVQNANADIVKVYIKEGGATNELVFIDGNLNEINFSRF